MKIKKIALLFFTLLWGMNLYAQIDEYLIKGVFIEKITRFVIWPQTPEFADTTKPIIIGIFGENPFDKKLNTIYSKQKIKSKPVEIRHISTINDVDKVDILFISYSESAQIQEILRKTKDKPILTFGDTQGYAEEGVMVNFYVESNRVRFEINDAATRNSKLQFSYILLNQAKIVK